MRERRYEELTARAILALVGMGWITWWNLTCFAFRCPSCEEIFEVTTRENLSGMNSLTTKHLTCKRCGVSGWAKVMRKR